MPSTSSRQPILLPQLRIKSQESNSAVRSDEFSLRSWSGIARNAFKDAAALWSDGRVKGDERKVEQAYLEYKKAAG
jgi:hypothetical protein